MPKKSSSSVKVFYPRFDREGLVALLKERLPALRAVMALKETVLFGSWSKGRATAFSDIDLLVVYGGPPRPDGYETVRRTLAIRGLEPHVYSEEEALALRPTLDRMTRDGIRLIE